MAPPDPSLPVPLGPLPVPLGPEQAAIAAVQIEQAGVMLHEAGLDQAQHGLPLDQDAVLSGSHEHALPVDHAHVMQDELQAMPPAHPPSSDQHSTAAV